MKEIITIKMVEQTERKFVADDGKEFTNEHECLNYERTRDHEKVEKAFARLDYTSLYMPFVDWFTDEQGFCRIVLNSKADFVAMNDYFKVCWHVYDNSIEEPTHYPCTKTIYYSFDAVGDYSGDLKAQLENALEQFK